MFTVETAEIAPAKKRLFEEMGRRSGRPTFVLGRNKYAASVARELDIAGFVDDYTSDSAFLGKPLLRTKELPRGCAVISCVVDGRPLTALNRLREAGVEDVLDYFTLLRLSKGQFRPVDYSEHNQKDLVENRAKYEWLMRILSDETSRRTLLSVSRFRFSGDVEHMRGFRVDPEKQYFEDFINLPPDCVFVDGGGFDGGTTKQFAQRFPAYRRIYYFEPSRVMMSISRTALRDVPSTVLIEKGLANTTGRVRFDAEDGPASRISDEGNVEIAVARLDDEIAEPVTFIKLDIEGSELDAIAGAQRHISSHRPVLAICVYHDQRDFWRIPERVLSYVSSYDVYLRHYTEGILETVMYFIPRNEVNAARH